MILFLVAVVIVLVVVVFRYLIKNSHVRVQRVNQPGVTEVKLWGAYENVSMRRPDRSGQRPR